MGFFVGRTCVKLSLLQQLEILAKGVSYQRILNGHNADCSDRLPCLQGADVMLLSQTAATFRFI
jgi:hypothetical protein